MPLVAWVTLLGVALLVAALALSLIPVAILLQKTSFNLGTIIAGVRAIAMKSSELDGAIGPIRAGLEDLRTDLDQLVDRKVRERATPVNSQARR
jgi:hypothetical protein